MLLLSVLYSYAYYKNKENYMVLFNLCKEKADLSDRVKTYPGEVDCIAAGGCFETCGSGCGLPKQTLSFVDALIFYFGAGPCPDSCTVGCIYHLE